MSNAASRRRSEPRDRGGDARQVAVAALEDLLLRGRALQDGLEDHGQDLDRRDRAFARELCYGVSRWLPRLQVCLDQLMEKPLRERETTVRVALLTGLYQLMYTRVAEHAAVDESVATVRRAGRAWATGLVNGVLRSFLRRREAILASLDATGEGRLAHPAWLVDATRDAWPDDWERVLEANNARPPLSLRVNASRATRDAYLDALRSADVPAEPIAHTPTGVRLHAPRDVVDIPGFADGKVSVQDGAAQLAAPLLGARGGMRVLDACAAPGGKAAHLLERTRDLAELVALDADDDRLARVAQNLDRLGLVATLVHADAGNPGDWWDGVPFDRVLVDAPCTGTGVIRRNPDIKQQRRPGDVDSCATEQLRLLSALWPLVARGGALVYATCSYLPRENDHVLAAFLAKHPDVDCGPLEQAWGRATQHGRQILPGENTMDGFYYALLGKH